MKTDNQLEITCSRCSRSNQVDNQRCLNCEKLIWDDDGILRLRTDAEGHPRKSYEIVRSVVENNNRDILGVKNTSGARPQIIDKEQLLKEFYDTRLDTWRVPLKEQIHGRALDVFSGYGRRSFSIAELADSVYAISPNIYDLKIINQRTDFYASEKVTPVHSGVSKFRFAENSFDTIFVDLVDKNNIDLDDLLSEVDRLLKKDGIVILQVSGQSPIPTKRVRRASDYKSVIKRLNELGYEDMATFGLWREVGNLGCVYLLGESQGPDHLLNKVSGKFNLSNPLGSVIKKITPSTLLNHFCEHYLVAASRTETFETDIRNTGVVETGRARATQFWYDDGELRSVLKYPNRQTHTAFNQREHRTIKHLRSSEPQIREDLPKGELLKCPLGEVRKESAVSGKPLSDQIDRSPEYQQMALEAGLDWLQELQRPLSRDRIQFCPSSYLEEVGVNRMMKYCEKLPNVIDVYKCPVHGDFLPENIFITGGLNIEAVIDWEYGDKTGLPFIDVAFFVAHVISNEKLSVPDAMVEMVTGKSKTGRQGHDALKAYCNKVDIDFNKFLTQVPLVYLHRIKVDREVRATSTYTNKESQRIERVIQIWERIL